MIKHVFIILCSLVASHTMYGMKSDFKTQKKERRIAYKKPYNKEDQQKLLPVFSTFVVGMAVTSAGLALQEPTIVGFGMGMIIGGTDEVKNYYKYERRYNQKTAQ